MSAGPNEWLCDLLAATIEMVGTPYCFGGLIAAGSGAATEQDYYQ